MKGFHDVIRRSQRGVTTGSQWCHGGVTARSRWCQRVTARSQSQLGSFQQLFWWIKSFIYFLWSKLLVIKVPRMPFKREEKEVELNWRVCFYSSIFRHSLWLFIPLHKLVIWDAHFHQILLEHVEGQRSRLNIDDQKEERKRRIMRQWGHIGTGPTISPI